VNWGDGNYSTFNGLMSNSLLEISLYVF
jgi:hypothetical protein